MPTASTPSGVDIAYETHGSPDAPAVLLLHGLGSQLLLWDEGFCALLVAAGFRVLRLDHRDSGRSTRLPEGSGYTLVDMAADAVAVLDDAGVARAHVVGFSLGGMVAQTVAVEHPDRCVSLVSMGSGTGNPEYRKVDPEIWAAMTAPAPDDREGRIAKDLADRRLWASPLWHDEEYALALYGAYEDRGFQARDAFERQAMASRAMGNREADLAEVTVPTRVIHGSADTLVDVSAGRRTAEVIPGADLVVVDGWGHDLPPGSWPPIAEAIIEHARPSTGTAR